MQIAHGRRPRVWDQGLLGVELCPSSKKRYIEVLTLVTYEYNLV